MTLTKETIAEIDRLDAEATPGPWRAEWLGDSLMCVLSPGRVDVVAEPEDTNLIVAMRNSIRPILDRLEKLEAIAERVRTGHVLPIETAILLARLDQ